MAWTLVGYGTASTTGGALAVPFQTGTPGTASLIVAFLHGGGSTVALPSGMAGTVLAHSTDNRFLAAAWGLGTAAASGTVLWGNLGGSQRPYGVVLEYTGAGTAVTSIATKAAQSAAGTLTSGTVAFTAGDLMLAAFGHNSSTTPNFTAGTGITELYDVPLDVSANPGQMFVGYRSATTAGSVTATVTTAESDPWASIAVVFDTVPLPAGPYADWGLDGFSTLDDFGDDVESWRIQRGASAEITGGATIGNATVVLNNTPADKYNPLNESGPLYGNLTDGVPIWIGVNSDGALRGDDPRGLFAGYIKSIEPVPVPGPAYAPKVIFTCEDALGRYSRTPSRVEAALMRSHQELREAILEAAGETRTDLATEGRKVPLSAWDGMTLPGLEAINQANGSRHFIKPHDNADEWYRYVTRDRLWRLGGTRDGTVDAGAQYAQSNGWTLSGDTAINQQRATVTPIVFTAGAVQVWTAETLPFVVKAATPKVIWVDFDDYVRDPVVDVNRTGSGITAAIEAFGDSAKLTLTSAGTTTVTGLSIEGRLARRLPSESVVVDNEASQDLRGVRAGSDIASPFLGVRAHAQGIADHVVWRYGTPQFRPTLTVTNWFPHQFNLDLYDVVEVAIDQLQTTMAFEIVGLTHEGHRAATGVRHHVTTYVLQECRVQSDPGWFVWDSSEWDGSDLLAY